MNTTVRNDKNNFFSEWLEKLQQESWQLELLISGLALFGIWESQSVIRRLGYYIDVNASSAYEGYGNIIVFTLWAAWGIFLINLLLHIIIRGLWIGAIGLRYVSGDIDFDKLDYSERFSRFLKKKIGSFDNYIERLEKLSSVLFSFTFLLVFMFVSFVVLNAIFALMVKVILNLAEDPEDLQGAVTAFGFLFYGLGLIVLVDFFTMGAFKKVNDRSFSLIYFYVYRLYSTISLSFIYRPLLLNFIDSKYTRRLFFLAIPYMLMILFLGRGVSLERHGFFPDFRAREFRTSIANQSANWRYYDDKRIEHNATFVDGDRMPPKTPINRFSLTSFEVEGDLLQLFIDYRSNHHNKLEEDGLTPFRKHGLKHSLFFPGRNRLPEIKRLDSIEAASIRVFNRVARGRMQEADIASYPTMEEDIKYWMSLEEDDLKYEKSQLRTRYDNLKEIEITKQLENTKKSIIDRYQYWIDDRQLSVSESLFYEHPNLHEKGIMVYLPLDSIPSGVQRFEIRYASDGSQLLSLPFLLKR